MNKQRLFYTDVTIVLALIVIIVSIMSLCAAILTPGYLESAIPIIILMISGFIMLRGASTFKSKTVASEKDAETTINRGTNKKIDVSVRNKMNTLFTLYNICVIVAFIIPFCVIFYVDSTNGTPSALYRDELDMLYYMQILIEIIISSLALYTSNITKTYVNTKITTFKMN
jgi:hypothetical protein